MQNCHWPCERQAEDGTTTILHYANVVCYGQSAMRQRDYACCMIVHPIAGTTTVLAVVLLTCAVYSIRIETTTLLSNVPFAWGITYPRCVVAGDVVATVALGIILHGRIGITPVARELLTHLNGHASPVFAQIRQRTLGAVCVPIYESLWLHETTHV